PRRLRGERDDLEADPPADLGADALDAEVLDRVLQPGPLAVLAVAVVALHGDDRLDEVDDPLRDDPAERHGETWVGVLLAGVAHAHAPADVDVVPGDRAGGDLAHRRDEGDVARQGVDAVVAGPGHRDLELPRQVDV